MSYSLTTTSSSFHLFTSKLAYVLAYYYVTPYFIWSGNNSRLWWFSFGLVVDFLLKKSRTKYRRLTIKNSRMMKMMMVILPSKMWCIGWCRGMIAPPSYRHQLYQGTHRCMLIGVFISRHEREAIAGRIWLSLCTFTHYDCDGRLKFFSWCSNIRDRESITLQ